MRLDPIDDARRKLESRERPRDAALEIDEREPPFGMLLRDSEHKGGSSWGQARDLARSATGADRGGYRQAFVALVQRAEELSAGHQAAIAR